MNGRDFLAPLADLNEKYEAVSRRLEHLLESSFIRSFDETNLSGEYIRDIQEADIIAKKDTPGEIKVRVRLDIDIIPFSERIIPCDKILVEDGFLKLCKDVTFNDMVFNKVSVRAPVIAAFKLDGIKFWEVITDDE